MYKYFFKRFLDIVGALIAMPFVILVIAFFGLIVYLTDRGSVFYNAKRAGVNGQPFTMFKLRTMYLNAPDIRNSDGSTFNSDNDIRVTPIGRFLRKTSLDEFPQFINVLIGDMSLVGPRPTLATKNIEEYSEVMKKRASVRPGITGYSQAFFRNSISQMEKFDNDCFYVENLTFYTDLKIILKTVSSVLRRQNVFVERK